MSTHSRATTAAATLAAAVALALSLACPCPAQDSQVVTLPAPPASAPGQPVYSASPSGEPTAAAGASGLMWKATSGANTVYLVGALHFGSADMYPLPEAIEAAFRASSVLAVEIDIRRVNPMQAMNLVVGQGSYPPGDTLWNHMSPQTRTLLTRFWDQRGLNPELFSRSRLWVVGMVLAMQMAESAGLRPDLGIDSHFLKEAGGKRVEELETVDQQMRALEQTPEREQERSLTQALGDPDRARQELRAMKTAWLKGDAAGLQALIDSGFEGTPETRKRLLEDRNASMAAAVERFLKGGQPCFVVVGAGHMVGPGGIVSLLERKGFSVRQVLAAK